MTFNTLGSVWCPTYDDYCTNQSQFHKENVFEETKSPPNIKPATEQEDLETIKVASKAGALVAWTVITLISCLMLSLAVITVFRSLPPKKVLSNSNLDNSFATTSVRSNVDIIRSRVKPLVALKSFQIDMTESYNNNLGLSRS